MVTQDKKLWWPRFDAHLRTSRAALIRWNQSEITKSTNVEKYLEDAQDASGLMAAFDLIEFAEGLNIPEDVINSSIMKKLRNNAANIVTWTLVSCSLRSLSHQNQDFLRDVQKIQDIAAYCRQDTRSDTRNLVVVLMEENRFAPQGAMDLAGTLVQLTLDNFRENEKLLPASFGSAAVDDDVRAYVRGLHAWIIGPMYWVYETERYFGKHREEVRALGWTFLGPHGSSGSINSERVLSGDT